jgi:hypothetical protein
LKEIRANRLGRGLRCVGRKRWLDVPLEANSPDLARDLALSQSGANDARGYCADPGGRRDFVQREHRKQSREDAVHDGWRH